MALRKRRALGGLTEGKSGSFMRSSAGSRYGSMELRDKLAKLERSSAVTETGLKKLEEMGRAIDEKLKGVDPNGVSKSQMAVDLREVRGRINNLIEKHGKR